MEKTYRGLIMKPYLQVSALYRALYSAIPANDYLFTVECVGDDLFNVSAVGKQVIQIFGVTFDQAVDEFRLRIGGGQNREGVLYCFYSKVFQACDDPHIDPSVLGNKIQDIIIDMSDTLLKAGLMRKRTCHPRQIHLSILNKVSIFLRILR